MRDREREVVRYHNITYNNKAYVEGVINFGSCDLKIGQYKFRIQNMADYNKTWYLNLTKNRSLPIKLSFTSRYCTTK